MTRKILDDTTPGWERGLAEADLTVWLTNSVPLFFRRVSAGVFWMGSRGEYSSEEPRHRVRITRPFFMATFPVTQHQYRAVIGKKRNGGLDPSPSKFKGALRPVENVSWEDAMLWCELLQRMKALRTAEASLGQGPLRAGLPTEAQWEFACRAGTDTEYYTGDGEAALDEAGWYAGNAKQETHSVGLKPPNDFRLYDMHGNVLEWCVDAWDEHAYKKRVNGDCNPMVNGEKDAEGLIRGGSWFYHYSFCRSAFRGKWWPDDRDGYLGFRICLFLGRCPVERRRLSNHVVGDMTT